MLAFGGPSAEFALSHRSVTAPVEENDALGSGVDGATHHADGFVGKRALHHGCLSGFCGVDELDLRKADSSEAFAEGDETVASGGGFIVSVDGGSG